MKAKDRLAHLLIKHCARTCTLTSFVRYTRLLMGEVQKQNSGDLKREKCEILLSLGDVAAGERKDTLFGDVATGKASMLL